MSNISICVCGHDRETHNALFICTVVGCACRRYIVSRENKPIKGVSMECRICHSVPESKDRIRNINLYVTGSEGLNICHACEIILVNTIRHMMEVSARAKIIGYKLGKKDTTHLVHGD